jgi:hypothetical protein
MTKRIILLASVLLLALNSINAQIEISWGKEFPMPKLLSSIDLEGYNNNYILAQYVQGVGNNREYYRFDKKSLSFQGQFDPVPKGSDIHGKDYYKTVSMKNKMIMLYDVYSKKESKYMIYAMPLGDDGKPSSANFIKLIDMESKSSRNKGDYLVILSRDSTKLCIIASPSYEKGTNEKLVITMFDGALKNLSSCQTTLNYKDQRLLPGTYMLSNDGDLIMQAQVQVEKKDRKKGEATSFPALFRIGTKDGKLDEYQVNVPGVTLSELDFNLDANNNLICAGFYADPKTGGKNDFDGLVYLRINKGSKQIEKTSMKPLPQEMINDMTENKKKRREQGISKAFRLKHVIPRADGSTIWLGEQYYWYDVTYCDSKGNCRTTRYHAFEGIITISITSAGEIAWAKILPMKQVFANSTIMGSYVPCFSKDKIFLVYNDNIKNREKNVTAYKDAVTISTTKKMVTSVAELDNAGNFTIRKAFDAQQGKVKYYMNTGTSIVLRNNSFATILMSQPGFCNAYCSMVTCGAIKLKRVAKIATFNFK